LYISTVLLKVLGSGKVLEFDTPQALLFDANSQFTSLVKQSGSSEAEHLKRLSNASKISTQQRQKIIAADEKFLESAGEDDRLILSVVSV
jgi:hypothetical protein